jgi:hypothetical protein
MRSIAEPKSRKFPIHTAAGDLAKVKKRSPRFLVHRGATPHASLHSFEFEVQVQGQVFWAVAQAGQLERPEIDASE